MAYSWMVIEKDPVGESYEWPGKFGVYRYSDSYSRRSAAYGQRLEPRREFLGVYDTLIQAVRAHPGAEVPTEI